MAMPTGTAIEGNYLSWRTTVKSWLLTEDHKRIAVLYLVSITVMFILGGIAAAAVRMELTGSHGQFMTSETYNKLFTMHGIVMVFFFLIPAIPAVLGNFLLPIMLGARDLAFPKLNLLSWYVFITGATMAVVMLIAGGVDTGDILHAVQHYLFEHLRDACGGGCLRYRVLVDLYRDELHRHHSQDAGSGAHLVAVAPVRLVDLCDQRYHRPRNTGGGHHARSGYVERLFVSASSIRNRW